MVSIDKEEGLNNLPFPNNDVLDVLDGPAKDLDVNDAIDPDELAKLLEDANEDMARQVQVAEQEAVEDKVHEEVQGSDEEEVGEDVVMLWMTVIDDSVIEIGGWRTD